MIIVDGEIRYKCSLVYVTGQGFTVTQSRKVDSTGGELKSEIKGSGATVENAVTQFISQARIKSTG